MADLDVATSENDIEQSIAQVYIQILYAAESVKVNENTLQVSEAQRDRGKQLLDAGSIARSDYAQLEAQVSTDRYQLVTAQATLQDYKLQLKQLLELDGEQEMNIMRFPTMRSREKHADITLVTGIGQSIWGLVREQHHLLITVALLMNQTVCI